LAGACAALPLRGHCATMPGALPAGVGAER
jgi:hypothetical protein